MTTARLKSFEHPRTLVVIGGGFSGAALAIQLLRQPVSAATRVVVIERGEAIGRGVAYARRDYPYLLNVPASQMSAFADWPLDFVDFAASRGIAGAAQAFLPRQLYGEYLSARLESAARASSTQFIRIRGEAIRAYVLEGRSVEHRRWNVALADGRDVLANAVVLATGTPPPRCLPELAGIAACDSYVKDPWSLCEDARIASGPGERVLIVGAGLTMADVAVRLANSRRPPARIDVLSRRILAHAPQTDFSRATPREADRQLLAATRCTVRGWCRSLRQLAANAAARGEDWRTAIALARSHVPTLWQQLDLDDRRRFLRHLQAIWDAHRHRLPPTIAIQLQQLVKSGGLQRFAGRLQFAEPLKRGVQVVWRERASAREQVRVYDRVINCTGPDYALHRSSDPLIRALVKEGHLAPDPLDLGLATGSGYRVIGRDRLAVDGLYYLGPALRARYWEATAVPELRLHAEQLARELARSAARPQIPTPRLRRSGSTASRW
ncbi:MAG TPA: FAD/NAD(P)-binding protein [Steroidobacteraceae bacterium]|nr:FAD/NAD(P)-binding protein [Steroidobacteraceae bacterium]